jgi:hypothetical protein
MAGEPRRSCKRRSAADETKARRRENYINRSHPGLHSGEKGNFKDYPRQTRKHQGLKTATPEYAVACAPITRVGCVHSCRASAAVLDSSHRLRTRALPTPLRRPRSPSPVARCTLCCPPACWLKVELALVRPALWRYRRPVVRTTRFLSPCVLRSVKTVHGTDHG